MRSAFPLMCMNPFSCNFSVANDEGGPCRPASPSRRLVVFSFCPLQTEGIALAQAADLPADKLLTVLDQGAMSNPMFRMKVRPKIRRKKAPPPPALARSGPKAFACRWVVTISCECFVVYSQNHRVVLMLAWTLDSLSTLNVFSALTVDRLIKSDPREASAGSG